MSLHEKMDFIFKFLNITDMFLWIFILLFLLSFVYLSTRRLKLPPGPVGVPILGYSPFLGANAHLHFYELSKKYGDVFGLYLGTKYTVIVADFTMAQELYKQYSAADRPPHLFDILPGGVGFAEVNGSDWLEQRRYTVQKMKKLGFGTSDWEKGVQMEAQSFVDLLKEKSGHPIDICEPLSASISNIVLSLVTGHILPMGNPKRKIVESGINAFTKSVNQSSLAVNFPWLNKMAINLGLEKADNYKDMMELNKYIRQNIEETKEETKEEGTETYIQAYLKEMEKNRKSNLKSSFNLTNLIGNVQALVIAGSDTTKISLEWLFLTMASHPDIQMKVHQELDNVEGEIGSWEHRRKLPYCHATILESQRWRTIAPMGLLHSTNTDTALGEFIIPKGANVIALLYAHHMNPRYWKDPETFRPERFLDEDGQTIKKPDNYAPFSYGKRKCVGETIANIEIFLFFVAIMQKFEVLPPDEKAQLDLKGILRLNFEPKRQKLRFILR